MNAPTHDTLVFRLAQILIKLNQGDRLDPRDLADEFGVNLRTVQRDLNVRLAYLPIEKIDGRYFIDPAFLGKLTTRDIVRFASLAGVRGLFPSLSDEFLRDIFDSRIQSALLVKGHNFEDISSRDRDFRLLQRAIVERRRIAFAYAKPDDQVRTYTEVEPAKLVNSKGIWYLAAKDAGKVKTFAFARITDMTVSEEQFAADPELEKMIEGDDGIWFGDKKKEIVLKVDKEIAGFFKRRKLIANQVIDKELEDGGLLISVRATHTNQVLAIVRYWLPHIVIVSPDRMQRDLENTLREYLSER